CAVDSPEGSPSGYAVIAHPHPQFGGTLDNKVVQTLARAFVELGYEAWRPNFRGVGQSEGRYDEGRGEVEDLAAVVAQIAGQRIVLAVSSIAGCISCATSSSPIADERPLGARRTQSVPRQRSRVRSRPAGGLRRMLRPARSERRRQNDYAQAVPGPDQAQRG